MSTTVAGIAELAFDGVAAAISGVIKSCTVTRVSGGTANRTSDTYTPATTTDTGRVVFADAKAAEPEFPDLVLSSGDQLAYIEGLDTLTPLREGDTLTVAGKAWAILRQQDIVHGAGLHAVVVREA